MPIQLTIQHPDSSSHETVDTRLDTDTIVIGRSPEAHVCLADTKRVVSKQHAEIRRTDDGYHLVDLGSKNFTFLGDLQLEPGRPYTLRDGDTFEIGDFTLTVRLLPNVTPTAQDPEADVQETVFAADFSNPFEAPVETLVAALQDIAEAYDQEAPSRRADALQDACNVGGAAVPNNHPGVAHLLSMLGLLPASSAEGPAPSSSSAQAPDAPSGPTPDSETTPPAPAPVTEAPAVGRRPVPDANGAAPQDATVADATLALAEAATRLIEIPWQFRHEFIGQTILQAPESAFLRGSPESVREALLSERLSPEERGERLEHLRQAVDAVAVHQVAMLDGYKASVAAGTEHLLDGFDPEVHRTAVQETSPLYQWIPPLAAPAILRRLSERHDELTSGAWSVAEHRIFRPAFIKAYLARMTAAHRAGNDAEAQDSLSPSKD